MTEVQAGWVGGNVAKREATARRAPARQRVARDDGEAARIRRAREALWRHSGVVQVDVRVTRRGTAPASRTSRAPSGSRARLASARAARFHTLSGPGELRRITSLPTPPQRLASPRQPFSAQTLPRTLRANSTVRPFHGGPKSSKSGFTPPRARKPSAPFGFLVCHLRKAVKARLSPGSVRERRAATHQGSGSAMGQRGRGEAWRV